MNPTKHSQHFKTFSVERFLPAKLKQDLESNMTSLRPNNQNNKTKKGVFLGEYKMGTSAKNELTTILEPNISSSTQRGKFEETKALAPRKHHNMKD